MRFIFINFSTVTFSRMDPEGKLIMGFRKASNSVAMQVKASFIFHISKMNNVLLI